MSLVDAVRDRDLAAVKALLASGADLERRSDSGDTPLMIAVMSDQFRIAEALIDRGADVFAYNPFGANVGLLTERRRLRPEMPEGAARLRVIDKMKLRGFPFPAPTQKELLESVSAGRWPPNR